MKSSIVRQDSQWQIINQFLCDRYELNYSKAQDGFRDLTDSVDGADIPVDLQQVITTMNTLPVTSPDAERVFSSMNVICSLLRNRLGIDRLSHLLFISLVGPPLKDFSAIPFVKKRLANHHQLLTINPRK